MRQVSVFVFGVLHRVAIGCAYVVGAGDGE